MKLEVHKFEISATVSKLPKKISILIMDNYIIVSAVSCL